MSLTVNDTFLAPVLDLIPQLDKHLKDLAYSDAEFTSLGLRRICSSHQSGRAFIQHARQTDLSTVSLRAYFAAASSPRRLAMLHELNARLSEPIRPLSDRFACFPELHGRDILAIDGHDVRRACHEPKELTRDGRLEVPDSVTGVFIRNLRSGAARVLAQTEGHQHEWSAVKARPWSDFLWREGAKGTVLVIDPVAVDFEFLRGAKFKGHCTVITRMKRNLKVVECRALKWDAADPRNDGVQSDERIRFDSAGEFRRVVYVDPETLEEFDLLTTEFQLAPGVIAHLYRLRWDIEKLFDQCENLLGENKAWATGPIPAQVQNEFLVIAHNLMLLLSQRLETQEGIRDEKVERKNALWITARRVAASQKQRKVSDWVRKLRAITRWSSQYVRWLTDAIQQGWEWSKGVEKLRPMMAAYLR